MPTISVMDIVEENRKLKDENERLKKDIEILIPREIKSIKEDLGEQIRKSKNENTYLLQRLKEMRHKTWFPVFKENLDLQEEVKGLRDHINYLDKENSKLWEENEELKKMAFEEAKFLQGQYEKEINQYKTVLQSVQSFINQYAGEKKEDKGCH